MFQILTNNSAYRSVHDLLYPPAANAYETTLTIHPTDQSFEIVVDDQSMIFDEKEFPHTRQLNQDSNVRILGSRTSIIENLKKSVKKAAGALILLGGMAHVSYPYIRHLFSTGDGMSLKELANYILTGISNHSLAITAGGLTLVGIGLTVATNSEDRVMRVGSLILSSSYHSGKKIVSLTDRHVFQPSLRFCWNTGMNFVNRSEDIKNGIRELSKKGLAVIAKAVEYSGKMIEISGSGLRQVSKDHPHITGAIAGSIILLSLAQFGANGSGSLDV